MHAHESNMFMSRHLYTNSTQLRAALIICLLYRDLSNSWRWHCQLPACPVVDQLQLALGALFRPCRNSVVTIHGCEVAACVHHKQCTASSCVRVDGATEWWRGRQRARPRLPHRRVLRGAAALAKSEKLSCMRCPEHCAPGVLTSSL